MASMASTRGSTMAPIVKVIMGGLYETFFLQPLL